MIRSSLIVLFLLIRLSAGSQPITLHYKVSIPQPASHRYHVELQLIGFGRDTLVLKMPKWMPGYYQIMDYAKNLEDIVLKDSKGKDVTFQRVSDNTLRFVVAQGGDLVLSYDVTTTRKFVATSFVDAEHAYLVPGASFFYVDGQLNLPASIEVVNPWSKVATGLDAVDGSQNKFTAPNFDILYDCPILLGNLEELPSFRVRGVEHRFMGYKLGTFDTSNFIDRLKKITEAAVDIIRDIPFNQYTYIAIGPGRGGIEHLNNTTVSFDGTGLSSPAAMNRMMNFLAHEYFHHYNVKRIRPLELGPFDYERGSPTNLLWLSEGLSVYYEYLIVRRAGLSDEPTLLSALAGNINAHENNPGRFHQSLVQASYNTWKDGPFGTQGDEPGKAISYYDKGPIAGFILDLSIRHATRGKKSLDDVMRVLYWKYYKGMGRGVTDAEVRSSCEEVAGASLAEVFEYIYTTKDIDYGKYLGYAGLKLEELSHVEGEKPGARKFRIVRLENPDVSQSEILRAWLGN